MKLRSRRRYPGTSRSVTFLSRRKNVVLAISSGYQCRVLERGPFGAPTKLQRRSGGSAGRLCNCGRRGKPSSDLLLYVVLAPHLIFARTVHNKTSHCLWRPRAPGGIARQDDMPATSMRRPRLLWRKQRHRRHGHSVRPTRRQCESVELDWRCALRLLVCVCVQL